MASKSGAELDWTVSTLLIGVAASVGGLLMTLALERLLGVTGGGLERYLLGGFSGALAVWVRHRRRPLITVLVFVPVLSLLLLACGVLFHVYVLGDSIEL